ncbi:MAG: hypothetical protein KDA78_12065 [Planctomycetaceae bacterium]|nr:hypothetical protein [Planctomycetaceae bacterium]
MTLAQELARELKQQAQNQGAFPSMIRVAAGADFLTVELQSLDRIGCELNQLTLHLDGASTLNPQQLQLWADNLSRRITYLLEQVGPVEIDPIAGAALIRSQKPTTQGMTATYYEFTLSCRAQGGVVLQRYEVVKGTPGRNLVSMLMTHEVLVKLVDDLVDTFPGSP